jgi:hypothetical protein
MLVRFGAFIRNGLAAPKADADAIRRVKDWAGAVLRVTDETAFAVNEIVCADPACPGLETVILVMEPGVRTRACKIPKGLVDITEEDVIAAVGA